MTPNPQQTAPPAAVEESLPLNAADSQAVAGNYIDCTESNDEDSVAEEEEDEEDDEKGDKDSDEKSREKNQINGCPQSPKWEDFFTTEKLPNSQNSLNSQNSQSCCSAPSPALSRMTGSQTQELFSEEEETEETFATEEGFSLTLSLSNQSSQNQDSELADTVILPPEEPDRVDVNTPRQSVRSDLEELPGSQGSSDFEIPCTPESKPPRPEELLQLYRKLAAGEELIVGKTAQWLQGANYWKPQQNFHTFLQFRVAHFNRHFSFKYLIVINNYVMIRKILM